MTTNRKRGGLPRSETARTIPPVGWVCENVGQDWEDARFRGSPENAECELSLRKLPAVFIHGQCGRGGDVVAVR